MDITKNLIQLSKTQKKIRKIGLFDSGIGGLTIAAPLMQQFPAEYIYVADNRSMPYGNKSASFLKERVFKIINFLIECQVDSIIIPCNTAYCAAYEIIEKYFSEISIINIVDPILPYVVQKTLNKKIILLATESTIKSGLYQKKLLALDKNLKIFEQECPDLALAIEKADDEAINSLLFLYTRLIHDNEIDTVLIACTHYGIVIDRIRSLVGLAQVISIHEHTQQLVTNLIPVDSQSTLSLLMSNYSVDESARIQSFFPALTINTITEFND